MSKIKSFYNCQAANAIIRASQITDSLFVYKWQSCSIAFSAYAMCNKYSMYIHYDRTWNLIVPELTVPQEKAMINEFNCALKPKAYT